MPNSAYLTSSEPAEDMRLNAIQQTGLSGASPRECFDRLTHLMHLRYNCEIALLTFVEESRQWFLSRHGLDFSETPRDVSFCNHVVVADKPVLIRDATLDPRFTNNALVTAHRGIRSYLGVPLTLKSGITIGSVCVADSLSGKFCEEDIEFMLTVSGIVQDVIASEISKAKTAKQNAVLSKKKSKLSALTQMLSSAESLADIGSWSVSTDLQRLQWSKGTYKMHGVENETPMGVKEAVNFYVKEDQQRVARHLGEALKYRSGFNFKAKIVTADNVIKAIEAVGAYVRGSKGEEDMLVGVIREV